MTSLLDVNLLIALLDPEHVHHRSAHAWFQEVGRSAWATCPIVENGVLRILSNPRYPLAGAASPARIATSIRGLRSVPGHVFWPDDLSLLDDGLVDLTKLISSRQITDTYLLGLAAKNKGTFATFDQSIDADTVRGGRDALITIPVGD